MKAGNTIPTETYIGANRRLDPLAAAKHFDDGATLIFEQLQRHLPVLSELCTSVGTDLSSRIQTNIYLTPAGAQGFAPHWDSHDVFVLQIMGRKNWYMYDTKIPLPLQGQHYDSAKYAPGPISHEFGLYPGDTVYIPRGLIHSATATDEATLHITLGVTAFTWTDYFLEMVAAAGLEEAAMRENLPLGFANQGAPSANRDDLYREKLQLLLSRFDAERVWHHFEYRLATANSPLLTNVLSSRLDYEPLAPESAIRRRAGVRVDVKNGSKHVRLIFSGLCVSTPSHWVSAIDFVLTADDFQVRELPDCLDLTEKVELVGRLIREGLLERIAVGDQD